MANEIRNIKPKVSIIMITYGHEKYIKQAIEGVFLQKTDFLVELIIANDISPDKSDIVIKETINNRPENIIVNYILNEKNRGPNSNYLFALSQAKGEYIASCEGDDYWTDPLKLSKQVEFLEKNEDFVLCFHKAQIEMPDGKIVDDFITKIPENYHLRETLAEKHNYIHTPTVLFRNVASQEELSSEEFNRSPIGDYFLYMLLTKYGKIGYLEDCMAIYRYGVGTFSPLNKIKKLQADVLLFTNLYSFEKDTKIKAIIYKNLLHSLKIIENEFRIKDSVLDTRRHKIIEKIYKFIKRK